jgi:5-bromo-4-chloroindolyl phosphate hydrolysis protein
MMPQGDEGTLLTIIMMLVTAVSVTFAIVSRGAGSRSRLALKVETDAEVLAKELACYKEEQAREHGETDANIKTIKEDIGEIKASIHRLEQNQRHP